MSHASPPSGSRTSAQPFQSARRLVTSLVALLAITLSACVAADRTTAPAPDVALRAAGSAKQTLTDAFVDAQGTYCDAATPGDCALLEEWGVGYYSGWCSAGCALGMGADFTGMNAKWWARNRLSPTFPAYYYTGAVSETRLADGRRRIIANIRGHNTFVFLSTPATAPGLEGILMGADFFEYPLVSPAAKVPVLGDASLAAELIVPANFVGMPDVSQMLYFPIDGMEIRRFDVTVTARGPLRRAYDGLPVRTIVDAHGTFRYMPKLAAVGVRSRRLIELNYDPTSRITVKAAPGQ